MTHSTPSEQNQCPCGEPGTVYADDEVTPLCGKCWWAIYGKDAGDART